MKQMSRSYADRLPMVITRPFNNTGPGEALNAAFQSWWPISLDVRLPSH